MKSALRIFLWLLLIPLLLVGGLIIYASVTDFAPPPGSVAPVELQGSASFPQPQSDTMKLMIWNIGYAGLGAEMDFFYDGGKGVRPEKNQAERYLNGIAAFLESMRDSVDLFLLQEVDRNSKRSWYVDQADVLASRMQGFTSAFALNYDVKFVPEPFGIPYTPYGKTYGGLLSLSRIEPVSAQRVQYPGSFSFPVNLFMLDRCALEQRFKLPGNRELIIVNTHNTAYDQTGEIKKVELEFMKNRYAAEVQKGNLVLIGGDLNQVPPGIDAKTFASEVPAGYTSTPLSMDQLPKGFRIWYNPGAPTNRTVAEPYNPGSTYRTLIDYFIASPGLELVDIETIDLYFQWTDHQPVVLTCVVPVYNDSK